MPEFLHELNIGQVYIAGDSLIYCGGDRQTLHSENLKKKKKKFGFFFSYHSLALGAYLNVTEAGHASIQVLYLS